MGLEIERKFLVIDDAWKRLGTPVLFHQGYLSRDPERSVRVRIEGDQANLNIKGQRGTILRIEYEYPIPLEDVFSSLRKFVNNRLSPSIAPKFNLEKYAGRSMNSMVTIRAW